MSMAKREAIIMTVVAIGGLIGANALLKPSPHHSIKASMDSQLHSYNAQYTKPHVLVEQNSMDTILDRTALMEKAKNKKPWNKAYAENERHR
ncbi:hypothetical protein SBOR_1194 [Sclerotinia borealis F-4128]|uniref:Uncharacterized protein n=1 Tax=Sclerotinia borealis (strain F-4128) TaxID=1432307 RepID=W9CQS4_SCLBF|nr:hypothetical protein SBOR_1194 [Sclerotinia borealis F-4128]